MMKKLALSRTTLRALSKGALDRVLSAGVKDDNYPTVAVTCYTCDVHCEHPGTKAECLTDVCDLPTREVSCRKP